MVNLILEGNQQPNPLPPSLVEEWGGGGGGKGPWPT